MSPFIFFSRFFLFSRRHLYFPASSLGQCLKCQDPALLRENSGSDHNGLYQLSLTPAVTNLSTPLPPATLSLLHNAYTSSCSPRHAGGNHAAHLTVMDMGPGRSPHFPPDSRTLDDRAEALCSRDCLAPSAGKHLLKTPRLFPWVSED